MNEEKLMELWGKVGFIVNLSQMIEYNIANILAFDEILKPFEKNSIVDMDIYNEFAKKADELYEELSRKTVGYGINKMFEKDIFSNDSKEYLKKVCGERNYVVHSLFKEDLHLQKLESEPTFYFERLEWLIENMNNINDILYNYLNEQKKYYKLIF